MNSNSIQLLTLATAQMIFADRLMDRQKNGPYAFTSGVVGAALMVCGTCTLVKAFFA